MPAPSLTPAPPAPLRSQNPATFTSLAEDFVDWWAGFPDELNEWAEYWDSYTPSGGASDGDVTASGLTMSTARVLGRTTASTGAIEELTAAQVLTLLGIANAAKALPLTFNFSADGEVRFYADEAMTLTQQATSGTGSVAYEKSTTAAPDTFSSTSSPISLQAGAWLSVAASSVTDIFAVHLKRTA